MSSPEKCKFLELSVPRNDTPSSKKIKKSERLVPKPRTSNSQIAYYESSNIRG